MSEWKARRFWKEATVERSGAGHAVRLDGKPVRTPAKTEVMMPSAALAGAVAAEWRAQGEVVDPLSMPLTRAVNATLDKVLPQVDAVAAELAGYGATDLLSYRAERPDGLVARQAAAWDPLLDWAVRDLGARLAVTQGVMPTPQPANAVEALHRHVHGLSPWDLTALSEFVTLSGSLVLGLAVTAGAVAPEAAWDASRIDEDWQAEQWGADEEEAERIAVKRADFMRAHRYLGLLRDG